MRIALLSLLLAPLALSQTTAPTVTADTRVAVRTLVGEVLVNGQAYEYDRQLADTIGPRLTGSDNYLRAVTWTQQQFATLGLKNIHTEPFAMQGLWEPEGPASGEITAPRLQHLHLYSAGWSPSTPKGGITGPVVYLKDLLPVAKLESAKASLVGQIVLVDNQSFGDKPAIGDLIQAFQTLASYAPKAVLLSGSANGTENASSLTFNGEVAKFPIAEIGREDELLIKRMLDHGAVTVHFAFANRIRPATQVMNVVAEIPGRELPEEYVIVGAHLDSWHPGTGAQDNGTGVATVLDVARSIQATGRPPRRTMRFILFGGEEQGLIGSTAYAKAHRADMPSIDAVLIADTGAQPAKGWYLMGRDDEKQSLAAIEPLLSGLGADKTSTSTEFLFETDNAGFDILGVPTLVLWNDVDKYFKLHHQASDTFDSVSQPDLTQTVATTAATAYAIADSAQPFAPHYTTSQVEEMLKKAGELDNYKALKSLSWVP